MKGWVGDGRPFGGTSFGAMRPVSLVRPVPLVRLGAPAPPAPRMAQPAPAPGPVSQALEKVRSAQKDQRGVERNLGRIDEALGPEAALQALEEANTSVEAAWAEYADVAQELE